LFWSQRYCIASRHLWLSRRISSWLCWLTFFSLLTILIELTFNFFLPDNSEFNSSQLNAQTLLVSAWRTVKEVIHQKWINWMNKVAKQILFCKKGGSFIWSNIIVDAWDKFSIF
jgi:hypothetical protein